MRSCRCVSIEKEKKQDVKRQDTPFQTNDEIHFNQSSTCWCAFT
jgi:hypothetical protein